MKIILEARVGKFALKPQRSLINLFSCKFFLKEAATTCYYQGYSLYLIFNCSCSFKLQQCVRHAACI